MPAATREQAGPAADPPPHRMLTTLTAATRKGEGSLPDEELFSCQATELLRAAPTPVPPWDVRQYVLDVRSGNAGLLATIRAVAIGVFNEYQDFTPAIAAEAVADSGRHAAAIDGRLEKTPDDALDLEPGGARPDQEQGRDRQDARRE